MSILKPIRVFIVAALATSLLAVSQQTGVNGPGITGGGGGTAPTFQAAGGCTHGNIGGSLVGHGFTSAPGITAYYVKCDQAVTLFILLAGISNATTFTVTGFSALGLGPSSGPQESPSITLANNGLGIQGCAQIQGDTLTFATTSGNNCNGTSGFTASGFKGVTAAGNPLVFSYIAN